jgi:hypothetical protein
MATLCFLCPSTGAQVQARFTDNASEDEDHGEIYERVTCTAYGRLHMVNPRTGEVLGLRIPTGRNNAPADSPESHRAA